MSSSPDPDPASLIACTVCDALYRAHQPDFGQQAVCARCHHVLIRPRRFAGMRIIMMSVTTLILIFGAVFFPFLRIEVQGFANSASVLDTALVFADGQLELLTIASVALVLLIPALRMVLLLYVLVPIVFDRRPLAGARDAFQTSETLKPWAMAEIFVLGCAVSLVKVGDLAQIQFGPAFWMFIAAAVVLVVQESFVCSWSIWNSLDTQAP
jgi:paraquat-inducible protein A